MIDRKPRNRNGSSVKVLAQDATAAGCFTDRKMSHSVIAHSVCLSVTSITPNCLTDRHKIMHEDCILHHNANARFFVPVNN